MSFGVIVSERTAPAAQGAPVDTSQAFVTGVVTEGPSTATLVQSIADFEAAFSTRTGANTALWDWLDVSFREGLTQAYVGGYETAGDYPRGSGCSTVSVRSDDHRRRANVGERLRRAAGARRRVQPRRAARRQRRRHADGAARARHRRAGAAGDGERRRVRQLGQLPASGVVASTGRSVPGVGGARGAVLARRPTGQPEPGGRRARLPAAVREEASSRPTTRSRCAVRSRGGTCSRLRRAGGLRVRAAVEQSAFTAFWQLNCSRARMWLKAQALAVGENYYMRTLDGAGKLAAQLGSDLAVVCAQLYSVNGLFGDPRTTPTRSTSRSRSTPRRRPRRVSSRQWSRRGSRSTRRPCSSTSSRCPSLASSRDQVR